MRIRYNDTASVTYEDAKARVLAKLPTHVESLTGKGTPLPAAACGDAIWPGHPMAPQGAGFAAIPILRKMAREGLIYEAENGWVKI